MCSSFGAEGVAMLRALEWLEEHPANSTLICTDSLSVHAALEKDDWKDCQDWIRKIKMQARKVTETVTISMGSITLWSGWERGGRQVSGYGNKT